MSGSVCLLARLLFCTIISLSAQAGRQVGRQAGLIKLYGNQDCAEGSLLRIRTSVSIGWLVSAFFIGDFSFFFLLSKTRRLNIKPDARVCSLRRQG